MIPPLWGYASGIATGNRGDISPEEADLASREVISQISRNLASRLFAGVFTEFAAGQRAEPLGSPFVPEEEWAMAGVASVFGSVLDAAWAHVRGQIECMFVYNTRRLYRFLSERDPFLVGRGLRIRETRT